MAFDSTDAPMTLTVVDPMTLTTPQERRRYLRDFLAELPAKRFNMNHWAVDPDGFNMSRTVTMKECNTAACVCGWVNAIWNPKAAPGDEDSAAIAIGLSFEERSAMFWPNVGEERPWEDIKPSEAVAMLDRFEATGEVTWG